MAWVLDLDGVIWLADDPIAGSAEAVARLRAAGEAVAFVTNNSYSPRGDVAAKLARHGIEAGDDVMTSAMAAAGLVEPGSRALVCGGPGVTEALRGRDVETLDAADPSTRGATVDVVVVGYHRQFDYERLTTAATAVRRGARLIGTNDDATYPTPDGPIPGGGSILAAVVTAAGTPAEVAGKPNPPMAELVRAHVGAEGLVVGDRPETDGRFAVTLGFGFGLVLSGVTGPDDLPVEPEPVEVAADLAALVESRLVRGGGR